MGTIDDSLFLRKQLIYYVHPHTGMIQVSLFLVKLEWNFHNLLTTFSSLPSWKVASRQLLHLTSSALILGLPVVLLGEEGFFSFLLASSSTEV